ncbi:MAG TPA: energy transducer TonB, partial [Verrucomicrobiae bacterium]|nr:energy transducer TonB [Verrucomicrobiae bacterium]
MRWLRLFVLLLAAPLAYGQNITIDAVSTMPVCSPNPAASAGPCATAPKPLSKVNPPYPEKARRARKEGTVVLGITVGKDGSVNGVHVVTSVDKDLDKAAIDAVNQWKFEPGTYQGNPVDVALTVTVNFSLSPNQRQSMPPGRTAEQSAAIDEIRNLWSDADEAYKRSDFAT